MCVCVCVASPPPVAAAKPTRRVPLPQVVVGMGWDRMTFVRCKILFHSIDGSVGTDFIRTLARLCHAFLVVHSLTIVICDCDDVY